MRVDSSPRFTVSLSIYEVRQLLKELGNTEWAEDSATKVFVDILNKHQGDYRVEVSRYLESEEHES